MNEFTSANCPGYTSDEIQKMNRRLSQKLEDHGLSASDIRRPGNAAIAGLIVQSVYNDFNVYRSMDVHSTQILEISKLRDELTKAYETCEAIARDHADRLYKMIPGEFTDTNLIANKSDTAYHIANQIRAAAPK